LSGLKGTSTPLLRKLGSLLGSKIGNSRYYSFEVGIDVKYKLRRVHS
jgi:hypothetical protein